ncbi:regulation of choline O-acetyltransferase protein, partial [Trichomonas vaginalis G3]|uniref:regulation of choline O-acetyltransferase protein n=1 Tax=Trichomonas vaginalis (strain ATCC PRA-98 / G3) TaxID=412133 RepID=UPI0021E55AE0
MILLIFLFWPKFKREDKGFNANIDKSYHKRTLYSSTNFEKIRISLDFQYFDGTSSDPLKCKNIGDSITWDDRFVQCIKDDIPNSTKIEAFKGTMNNVKDYLERFLKVIHYSDPISLKSDPTREKSIVEGTNISNTDIYLVFFLRPFGDDSFSSISHITKDDTYNRNIQTNVYMKQSSLPDIVQNENSEPNGEFYRTLSFILRYIAISENYINKFHPKYDPTPYTSIICNLTKYGKRFSILTTPHAHHFAKKNYGNSTFYGDDNNCPSGIVIEDYGTAAGDLPKSTIYYTDTSNYMSMHNDYGRFRRVSDVTMAFLLDSGNYEVNWSMGQPM